MATKQIDTTPKRLRELAERLATDHYETYWALHHAANEKAAQPPSAKNLLSDLVDVLDAYEGRRPTFANQGQAMDGYAALAAFVDLAQRAKRHTEQRSEEAQREIDHLGALNSDLVEPLQLDDVDRALIKRVDQAVRFADDGHTFWDAIDEGEVLAALRLLIMIIDEGHAA